MLFHTKKSPPKREPAEHTRPIRDLNDAFPRTFAGGRVMLTAGFNALPDQVKQKALDRIKTFDAFEPGNDPYCEHDFVSIEIDSRKLFAKVDYYDRAMKYGSSDLSGAFSPPAPVQTLRTTPAMAANITKRLWAIGDIVDILEAREHGK